MKLGVSILLFIIFIQSFLLIKDAKDFNHANAMINELIGDLELSTAHLVSCNKELEQDLAVLKDCANNLSGIRFK
jgi:hypothetical protein